MAATAGTIPSLQVNRNLNYVFTSIDPTSLILSQFSHTFHQPPYDLQLSSQSYYMERGSRYQEYAALREYKLRMKKNIIIKQQQQQEDDFNLLGSSSSVSQLKQIKSPAGYLITPPPPPPISTTKKPSSLSSKGYSADYGPAAAIPKKENGNGRAAMASGLKSKSGTYDGILGKMVGRKKSYASLEALKGLGSQARRAINGESKGMRTPRRNCNLDKTEFAYSSQF